MRGGRLLLQSYYSSHPVHRSRLRCALTGSMVDMVGIALPDGFASRFLQADRRATPPVPQEVKLASPKPRHPDSAREPSRSKVDVSNDENIMERVIPIPEVGLPLLSVYNEPLVRGLYALMWGDREESMKAVQRHLNDREFLDSIDKQLIFDTTVTILASSLK